MGMESVSLSYTSMVAPNHKNGLHKNRKYPLISTNFAITTRTRRRFPFSVIKNYKQYHPQDFHGYAKPLRLLEATEPKVCTETSQQKDFLTFNAGGSQSLFKVKIQTSNAYGSSLSDPNAGVLLCLIDTNGSSILQTIHVILKSNSAEPLKMVEGNPVHFQRGSADVFMFEGPKLEGIEALWISIESGQWRLGGVSLTVISPCETSLEGNDREDIQFTAFQYEFQVDDILLGEGTDISVVELRPSLVSELSRVDPYNLLSKTPESTSISAGRISNEESMREYADLKLSLLSYDAALIFLGTIVANFSADENSAFAFFIGGIFGFSYLLLLQRSVDGLPSSSPVSSNTGGIENLFRGLKGPVSGLALAIGLTSLAVKFSSGDFAMVFTPKDLLIGTMGFLACKVAVVLAAFKPISLDLKENE
ncbi:uncharacterized protein LOC8271542 [Ricinus communis]|uniref:uncharacterized protein LOC8271542 n=1 Tax=Ricinus communis TaxID=3988 RepID=UPI00201A524C|nr:uncharacterized protein LOC8271542 [Ricinus communis]